MTAQAKVYIESKKCHYLLIHHDQDIDLELLLRGVPAEGPHHLSELLGSDGAAAVAVKE